MPVAVERYLSSILPIAIQRGAPWGFQEVRVRAFAPDIEDVPSDVWEGPSEFLTYLGSQSLLDIVSDDPADDVAGTGARRLQIDGLDNGFNAITDSVVLSGTTPVTTSKAFLRVNSAFLTSAGANGTAVGNVTIRATGSGPVQTVITPTSGSRSQQSHFTIPLNRTAYVMAARFAADLAETRFDLQARQPGGCFVSVLQFQTGQTPTDPPFVVPEAIFEKSDVKIVSRRLQGPSAAVFASYDLITAPKSLSAIRSFGQPAR